MYRSLQVLAELALLMSSSVTLCHHQIVSAGAEPNWTPSEDSWNYWWSYSGVSGPAYWGLLNLDWFLCDKGKRQSPIDIETRSLVYDPHLTPLRADNNLISGILYNDGHAIVFNGSLSRLPLGGSTGKSSLALQDQQQQQQATSKPRPQASRRRRATTAPDRGGEAGLIVDEPLDGERGTALGLAAAQSDASKREEPDSTSILRELSNSVELSISQNERLELAGDELAAVGKPSLLADGAPANAAYNGDDDQTSSDASANFEASDADDANNSNNPTRPAGVHFSGAGLIYSYKFETLYLRFGAESSVPGSEHQINSRAYTGELQLLAYNSALYKSFAEASSKPHGLLGVSVLIDLLSLSQADRNASRPQQTTSENSSSSSSNNNNNKATSVAPNGQLESLLSRLDEVKHRGSWTVVRELNLSALLPDTDFFVNYGGSLTTPGCHESVNWLVLNKPLYITQSNLDILRSISADEQSSAPTGTLIAGNIRPVQAVNSRPIRTNIRPSGRNGNPEACQRLWTKYEYRQSGSGQTK